MKVYSQDNWPVRCELDYQEGDINYIIRTKTFNINATTLLSGQKVYKINDDWPPVALCQPSADSVYRLLIDTKGDQTFNQADTVVVVDEEPLVYSFVTPGGHQPKCYQIHLGSSKGRYYLCLTPRYVLKGILKINSQNIPFQLFDTNMDGTVQLNDALAGTNIRFLMADTVTYPYGKWSRTNTIIEIDDQVLVVDSIEPNERAILFKKSPLPLAQLGEKAPEFSIPNFMNEGTIHASDYQGKWLLIDFWYTGCAPCIQSFSKLRQDLSAFRDQMAVLSICMDWDKNKEKALSIITKYRLDWDHGLVSPDDDLWKTYGSINENNQSYPLYLLLDPGGMIVWAGNPLRNQSILQEILYQYLE